MGRRSLLVAGLQTAGIPNDPAATLDVFERQVCAVVLTLGRSSESV